MSVRLTTSHHWPVDRQLQSARHGFSALLLALLLFGSVRVSAAISPPETTPSLVIADACSSDGLRVTWRSTLSLTQAEIGRLMRGLSLLLDPTLHLPAVVTDQTEKPRSKVGHRYRGIRPIRPGPLDDGAQPRSLLDYLGLTVSPDSLFLPMFDGEAVARNAEDAELLVARLRQLPSVVEPEVRWPVEVESAESVYLDSSVLAPTCLHPAWLGESKDWRLCQQYLKPPLSGGAQGIDACYAWSLAGGRGEGVTILDLEQGWNLHHEVLPDELAETTQADDDFHGTAVLGICCARDQPPGRNGKFGVVGVAPESRIFLMVPVLTCEGVADAVRAATIRLNAGDVMLVELQTAATDNGVPSLPVTVSPAVRSALSEAAKKGIYIVVPAGNGGVSLDDRLPALPAILVGAGHPITGVRVEGSNYGKRVDVQSWGMDVATAGGLEYGGDYCDLQCPANTNRCYTRSFKATSGAAAIVAGVVASISGVLQANRLPLKSPQEMALLLRSTGLAAVSGENPIGPSVNLRRALERLQEEIHRTLPDKKLAARGGLPEMCTDRGSSSGEP
ncbi:MAG TPA: S8 family serine peptidase [Thermoanaerobaculia bacterium]|jgi:hypothetical protein|nr:S8 family serine peptidase [Thermoanaerobaculia bacterium]